MSPATLFVDEDYVMSEAEAESTATRQFDVCLYDLPKVDAEGKSIPTDPAQTREFTELEEARKFVTERQHDFDRIVLIERCGNDQKLVERFRDGERILPDR